MDANYQSYGRNIHKAGISKNEPHGVFSLNGRVDKSQVACNMESRSSYFGQPQGNYRHEAARIREGDMVFNIYDKKSTQRSYNMTPYAANTEANAVNVLSVLNGHGDITCNNYDIMRSLVFRGVAETDSETNGLFPIIVRGAIDIRLNGNRSVDMNQQLVIYVPTPAEVSTGGGHNKTEAEESGVVKVWVMPYDSGIHKNHVSQIYRALTDRTIQKKPYHQAYRKHCNTVLDSVIGTSMVSLAKFLPTLRKVLTKKNSDTDILNLFLTLAGHSHCMADESVDFGSLTEDIIDGLFVPHSLRSSSNNNNNNGGNTILFPTPTTEVEKRLNFVQSNSMGAQLHSVNETSREIEATKIGTSNSAGKPGDYINVLLGK